MTYTAPLQDMRFVLEHVAGLGAIAQLPGRDHATPDVVDAVLEEAARVSRDVWAPTNVPGDRNGARIASGKVATAEGFPAAYRAFAEGGWNGLTCAPEHGGQGLPWALGMAVTEMWQAANMALSLCPLLTAAAIEAIAHHGDDAQKALYLPRLVSGEWTGTMNLTEPQAGTDLAAIRTVAKKNGDHYLMKGQKIFITFGEHDFTPNIIHLVLARVEGLPEGNDGLGLFIVPKFLVNPDGSLGARNDVKAAAVEHKLGIHGSPTCVMMYGEEGAGAVAYLVGAEGKGLRNMFTMMNNARIGVGLQGVALSERALQHARRYANERVQSARMGDRSGKRVPIIEHADVRRMLLTMKATTEAARALAYYAGSRIDHAAAGDEAAARRVDLLTPLVKAWSTDLAVDNASLGVQIHGGMGFIEETGAAQYYRDARILPIYEGTNGIQANDLVFRKVLRDKGAEAQAFLGEIRAAATVLSGSDDLAAIRAALLPAAEAVGQSTQWILSNAAQEADAVAGAAVPYLRQFSLLAGGHMMAVMARAAHQALFAGGDAAFLNAKIMSARFFAETLLPQVHGLAAPVTGGHKILGQMTAADF